MAQDVAERRREPRILRGSEKVAAILMAMSRPIAGRIMSQFGPEDIKDVTQTIAQLRPITADQLEGIVEDFTDQLAHGIKLMGNPAEVAKMLDGVLPPERISAILTDMSGRANKSIWDRISAVPEANLTAYLLKEHPQTAAVILSKLKPAAAARIMSQLPTRFRDELARRMLTVKPVVEETMKLVERTLYEDFMMNFSRTVGADPHARMADIINKMERDNIEGVLAGIAATHPKSAEILKGLLFTFDDITKLPSRARTILLDRIPNEKVVMALRGTEPEFRELMLSSMAARTRRMVESELASGEAPAGREVHEARRFITDLALEMAGRGEIELATDEADDTYAR